jgi:hypothetical protein
MVDDLLSLEHADPTEAAALAGRLRFAAESLALEFEDLSPDEAERLIFGVAREFLSDAQVAQFVPTLATRRARQVLRSRPPGELFVDLVAAEPVEVAAAPAVRDVPAAAAPPMPPPMPPAYYAGEAKRLLERARALRATVPEPGPIGS